MHTSASSPTPLFHFLLVLGCIIISRDDNAPDPFAHWTQLFVSTKNTDRQKRKGPHVRNRALTSIIPHQARPRPIRPNTRNIDNRPSPSLLERRHRSRNTMKHTLNIDIETAVKLIFSDVERRLVLVAGSRVVDDDVEATEFFLCGLHELGPDGGVGDGARDGGDVVRDVGVGGEFLREGRGVEVDGHDFAAFGDEEEGCCEAEAGCGAYLFPRKRGFDQ